MQVLVQAMQTQAHTQAALQAQLEAQRLVAFDHRTLDEALSAAYRQEGEMEQYLEEKKASQKRPAATFQRQDKKKTVYQTPQRSVAVGSTQVWMEAHMKFDYVEKQPTPSRIFLRSSVYCSRASYQPEDEIKCVTAHLKSKDAKRDYLGYFLMEDFIARPLFMKTIEFWVRTREDIDLWLIGPSQMVIYQPHKCQHQLEVPHMVRGKKQSVRTPPRRMEEDDVTTGSLGEEEVEVATKAGSSVP
ncbi:hypothetical protein Taro_007539 [Colocasia esculenta]|uniref:Uncharacterized protein n=1 Tax=Colocasia esculenta TaxID=4460 RepID=A0A843TZY5_COLES|nr:hypothetical protein [Colocasia esculenta]